MPAFRKAAFLLIGGWFCGFFLVGCKSDYTFGIHQMMSDRYGNQLYQADKGKFQVFTMDVTINAGWFGGFTEKKFINGQYDVSIVNNFTGAIRKAEFKKGECLIVTSDALRVRKLSNEELNRMKSAKDFRRL